ncbi:MAG TPA: hypothetical protein VGP93_09985, partial [Polyangiaceae bacterium]|nr:hypothetical protein [Polyangiaceae bacterium]
SEFKDKTKAPVERLRHLVVSDGAAPSAKQRKQLHTVAWEGKSGKIAVVTTVLSNPIKRGIATALSWMNPGFGFFGPEQFYKALAHIDMTSRENEIWAEYQTLRTQLPPNATLDLIENVRRRRAAQASPPA